MPTNLRALLDTITTSTDHTMSLGTIKHFSQIIELRNLSGGIPLLGPIFNANCAPVATRFLFCYSRGINMTQVPWQMGGAGIESSLHHLGMPYSQQNYYNMPGQCVSTSFHGYLMHPNLHVSAMWNLLRQICDQRLHRVFAVGALYVATSLFDYHNITPARGNHVFNIVIRNRYIKIVDVRSGSVVVFNPRIRGQNNLEQEAYFNQYMSSWQTFMLYEACVQNDMI